MNYKGLQNCVGILAVDTEIIIKTAELTNCACWVTCLPYRLCWVEAAAASTCVENFLLVLPLEESLNLSSSHNYQLTLSLLRVINVKFPLPPHQKYWHHTVVRRTWLFIAYSDEKLLYYKFSLPHLYIFSLKGRENVLF